MSINRETPRAIEVRFRDVSRDGVSLEQAERFERSVCDALHIVQRYDDNVDGQIVTSYVTASADHDGRPMSLEELYRVWLALAGEIVNMPDDSPEALAIRRLCNVVLMRVNLNSKLERATPTGPSETASSQTESSV